MKDHVITKRRSTRATAHAPEHAYMKSLYTGTLRGAAARAASHMHCSTRATARAPQPTHLKSLYTGTLRVPLHMHHRMRATAHAPEIPAPLIGVAFSLESPPL